jgi:hypothetical protein
MCILYGIIQDGSLPRNQRGRSWRGGRVELQPRSFIVGRLGEDAEPDGMLVVHPLQGEMRTVLIVGSDVLRMPVERCDALKDGLERLHIQGESWQHDGAIMRAADEFHAFVLLMIPPSQRSHWTVGFHAARYTLNQRGQSC